MNTLPSRRYSWYVVGLLTVAYAISLLDRWILSLLVAPVKAHFGVSDTQMGLLMGAWFAIFFATMGLPFGYLADRYNRKRLIGLAMAFWCLMTAWCGLAKSFGQLAAARLGIGLGEAALTPAANSMIADLFPRSEQSRAISVFNTGIALGMGTAYLVGGQIVAWMAGRPPVVLPLVGALESWQLVFIAAGAPGLFVALLILMLREPVRRGRLAHRASDVSLARCLAYLRENRNAYLPLAIGMITSPLIGYAWQWLPTMFDRVWGWHAPRFAAAYGWILLIVGPIGAVSGGLIVTRMYRRGRANAPFIGTMVALVVMVITSAAVPLAPSPEIAVALLVPATWAGGMSSACGAAAAVFAAPGEFRAQITSLYVLMINGFGLLIGPSVVGLLNDRVFVEPDGVRWSLALVTAVMGGAFTLYGFAGRGPYERTVQRLEATPGESRGE